MPEHDHDTAPTTDGRASLRITKLRIADAGYVTANASVNGTTRAFHNRFGSWLTDRRRGDDWPAAVTHKEALPHVAAALQRRAAQLLRREGRVPAARTRGASRAS